MIVVATRVGMKMVGAWCRDDRRDASPRRNKQEREVDEEGFEMPVCTRC